MTWRFVRLRGGVGHAGDVAPGAPRVFDLFWARSAIYQAVRLLRLEPDESVLVPAYHCAAAVEPVRRGGARAEFYNVTRACVADVADIERRIDRSTRAVLVIHYFGLPQPMSGLLALCRERGLRLIEDCAHVLPVRPPAEGGLGSFGDVSVFSWRKFLPIDDGGRLVVNDPALAASVSLRSGGLVLALKSLKNTLEKCVHDSGFAGGRRAAAAFRAGGAVARKLLQRGGRTPAGLQVSNSDLHFDLATADLRMSSVSRTILRSSDLPAIAARRRDNWRRILSGLSSVPGVRPLSAELPEDASPWVFPIVSIDRDGLHRTLRARGIDAFTWDGVIHPTLPLDEFPDARYLYDRLVLLPTHQTLDGDAIETMLRALREVIGRALTSQLA